MSIETLQVNAARNKQYRRHYAHTAILTACRLLGVCTANWLRFQPSWMRGKARFQPEVLRGLPCIGITLDIGNASFIANMPTDSLFPEGVGSNGYCPNLAHGAEASTLVIFTVAFSRAIGGYFEAMSIDELKGEAKTWSLASDSKLLEYLQQFSSGVTDRTKSFANQVDELSFDVAESEVSLKNTFNDFLMLGNSQFIENVSILA